MDKSDAEWIDNYMNNLVPFQWSIKLDNGEIYVVQADVVEQLEGRIEEVKTKFINSRIIPEQPPVTTTQYTPNAQPSLVCETCGGKAEIKEGTSKAGNHYKIFRCISNPETQPNGHSKFIK